MGDAKVLFQIEVMSDKSIKLKDAKDNLLTEIEKPEKLLEHLNKTINTAIVTPMYTYFETNSGVIILNGHAYYVP